MSRTIVVSLAALLVLGCSSAERPYLGTWVPSQDAIDVSNFTVGYEMLDSASYQVTADNQTYLIRTDGSETDTPWGGTVAIRVIDSMTWESSYRVDGNVIGVDTLLLSPDGQGLTIRSNNLIATEGPQLTVMELRREGEGSGLAGSWKGTTMSGEAFGEISFVARGSEGITASFPAMQATCSPDFDGSDAAATSPMMDDGWTCAMNTTESGALLLTWKRAGEPRYTSEYTVSADGNQMTEVMAAVGTDEPVTINYQRRTDQ